MKMVLLLSATILASASWAAGEATSASAKGWTQKQFITTFWCPPPPTEEAHAAVAAEHYTWTWVPVEGLDLAAKHGLRAMLTDPLLSPASLEDPAKQSQLDALIERVKKHAALEAYYILDEPSAGAFPALGKLVAHLRQRDPAHLAYINLFPTYANETQLGVSAGNAPRAKIGYPENLSGVGPADPVVLAYREHLKYFVEEVKPDLISYDHYHFMKDGTDGGQYFLNLALIRDVALEAGKPFLNIIQASLVVESWRLPNPAETRFLVFTTLAYGGRGISYFTYWGPEAYGGLYREGKASPMAKEVAAINAELKNFGPTLLILDSLGVYHTAPLPYGTEAIPAKSPVQVAGGEFVLGLFGKAGSRPNAFMVVNRSYKEEALAELKIDTGRSIQELDRKTGQWTKPQPLPEDRSAKIKLAPGDGRLFRMVD